MSATAQRLRAVVVSGSASARLPVDDEVAVERVSVAALPGRLARPPLPDVVAVLPDVDDPVALAQLVGGVDHELSVVLAADHDDCAQLVAALQFTPFVGPQVRCLEAGALGGAVLEGARQTRERRRHRADVAAATGRLTSEAPPPPPHVAESLASVLEATAVGIVIVDAAGDILQWTGPAVGLFGGELSGRALVDLVAAEDRAAVRVRLETHGHSTPEPLVVRLAGQGRYVELTPAVYSQPGGEPRLVVLVADATERVFVDAARRQLEREQRFLAEAGAVLDASLDLQETLERIAGLAVPDLGELCVVDQLDADGRFTDATVVAADASVAGAVREIRSRWPMHGDSGDPVARVVRTGLPELLRELSDEDLERSAQSAEHLELMRRLHYRSAVVTPLTARGRSHGALSVLRLDDPTPYEPADLTLVATLAGRAATALDNAWLYERERGIAATLQGALLPDALPPLDGAEVAARYSPAGDGLEVGGDWYDVIPLGAGRVGLAIGDVVGRGLPAAAVMGQLRNFLRAHALDDEDPAETVDTVGRLMTRLAVGDFATLLYAIVDVPAGRLRFASAGHPPPLLLGPDGEASLLETGRQPPLAAGIDRRRQSCEARLDEGATLVLYTDGLVERRGEAIDVGLRRLCEAAAGWSGDVEGLCDRLLAQAAPEAAHDDRALLAVRRRPGREP